MGLQLVIDTLVRGQEKINNLQNQLTGVARSMQALEPRGPLVQVTGTLFLLEGAIFGIGRAINRVTNFMFGYNIEMEK